MDPDSHLIIAIIAAMLNVLLSLIVPPIINSIDTNNTIPFSHQIKQHYENNSEIILISSILTVMFVYVSLKITPFVSTNIFSNLAKLA